MSTQKSNLNVEPLKGKSYLTIPVSDLLQAADEKNVLVRATLRVGGQIVSSNGYYFRPYKEMTFGKPNIKTEIGESGDGFNIKLSSDRAARAVELYGFTDGFFVDNYFDLLPDRPVEVHYRSENKLSLDEFRKSLKVRSLADAF